MGYYISMVIVDTFSATQGALDIQEGSPLRICERGGRKIIMIPEFKSAKEFRPKFELYDKEGG